MTYTKNGIGKIEWGPGMRKVQKIVGLFIDDEKACLIGTRCAAFIMRESERIRSRRK